MPSEEISTHTLTWSVTLDVLCDTARVTDFNSHAHVERDKTAMICPKIYPISTHTLTWSVTLFGFVKIALVDISTHTLTWSVTNLACVLSWLMKFQLTRSRGA